MKQKKEGRKKASGTNGGEYAVEVGDGWDEGGIRKRRTKRGKAYGYSRDKHMPEKRRRQSRNSRKSRGTVTNHSSSAQSSVATAPMKTAAKSPAHFTLPSAGIATLASPALVAFISPPSWMCSDALVGIDVPAGTTLAGRVA